MVGGLTLGLGSGKGEGDEREREGNGRQWELVTHWGYWLEKEKKLPNFGLVAANIQQATSYKLYGDADTDSGY